MGRLTLHDEARLDELIWKLDIKIETLASLNEKNDKSIGLDIKFFTKQDINDIINHNDEKISELSQTIARSFHLEAELEFFKNELASLKNEIERLTKEKEITKAILNKNKKIQIIDVSYGIKYHYGVEELWLNPNNFLMLANTVKSDLIEISANKYAAEDIEKKYEELEEDLSILDNEIRNIAESAIKSGSHTIVIADDAFGFLAEYGFEIVNISNENNINSTIKNKFKNKNYKYILVRDKENAKDAIKDIVDNYGATLIEIDTMETLSDEQRKNNDNYLSIMNEFITNLGNITLK